MTYETLLERILTFARQAGAPSEEATERDGGFSYHAESHAFGVGLGVGFAAVTTGNYRIIALITSGLFGLNRIPEMSSPRITGDLRKEPHYCLFGIVIGAVVGGLIVGFNEIPGV